MKIKDSTDTMENKSNSTEKILLLLELLMNSSLNKKEIVEHFQSKNIELSQTSLKRYLEVLKSNNIGLIVKSVNKENTYHIEKQETMLDFTQDELASINNVKKLLRIEKNHTIIRQAMSLFYKLALHTKNIETQLSIVDFGYYSKINWNLVKKLSEHCKNKNIIEFDYILPDGTNRFITMHVDSIKSAETSERLYLIGVFQNAKQFSKLPIDRIASIENVIQSSVRFDLEVKLLEYKISRNLFENLEKDKNELIVEKDKEFVTIKRPVNNEFEIVQKFLSYCPELYHISDRDIKKAVIEKLDIIKANYDRRYE